MPAFCNPWKVQLKTKNKKVRWLAFKYSKRMPPKTKIKTEWAVFRHSRKLASKNKKQKTKLAAENKSWQI